MSAVDVLFQMFLTSKVITSGVAKDGPGRVHACPHQVIGHGQKSNQYTLIEYQLMCVTLIEQSLE